MSSEHLRHERAEPAGDNSINGLSPWAAIVGPCHTADSLSRELGLPRDAVSTAATELRVLRLRTADGTDIFPAFQVRGGLVQPDLRPVLENLRRGVDDPWTWAQWLNTALQDRPRPIDELWAGGLTNVLRDARHDAWAWQS